MNDEVAPLYRRVDALEVSEVPDGYVIYDSQHGQVHYLNLTAATVLELCSGHRSAETIAAILQEAFGLPVLPLEDVEACLASLLAQSLIEAGGTAPSEA